ncbi:MAG: ferritin family protein [Deltaproteobacteria bacterium]|nr:ferritin family protein [Deltaproteobacteria bacterium]
MFSIHDIIALAIRLEENGERVYRNAAENADDPAVKEFLEFLADEEKAHAQWFHDLKNTLESSEDRHILKEMSRSLAEDFFGTQTFSLKDADFSKISSLDALIDIAVGFEKDSVLFYEMLAPFLSGNNAAKTLKRIIEEENAHVEKLKDVLPRLARNVG